MTNVPAFDDEHLEMDLTIPDSEDETTFPDVYGGLEIGLLAPGDGIVTDRHHALADRYEADDTQNQIVGQVSSFTLSGRLRYGCGRVLRVAGATACYPGEASAEFVLDDVSERDLETGYHEKGTCVEEGDADTGCLIYDLFGGFGDRAGRIIRRWIRFSPIRRQVDVLRTQAVGRVAEQYCGTSEFTVKSLTSTEYG